LRAAPDAPGGEVALLSFHDERAEAEGVAALANGLIQREGMPRSQILVLLRGDFHGQFSNLIRKQLTAYGVPSYDPAEIDELLQDPSNRQLVETFRLIADPEDSIAWASLLKLAPGIGDGFADYIYTRARDARASFGRTLLNAFDGGFPNANRATARRVTALVEAIQGWVHEHQPPEEREHGWGHWIIEAAGGNIVPAPSEAFASLLRKLDALAEVGQDLSRYIGQIGPLGHDIMQTECDGVRIMTMTASKGLTVEAAIIAAAEDGVIPRPDGSLSEERRLMYVAMTRAKKHLYCTWAQRRRGPTARAGEGRVRAFRQVSNFLAGGPVVSQDGSRFVHERFR
jgi:DNA helicase-2/ATP-dependent DNA helicase PcrA